MKWIFISHPLTSNIEENRKKEKQICKDIIAAGEGLPISPLNMFGYIEKEEGELRENIMAICKRLIDLSDEVWIYGDSQGCKEEQEYAAQQGKTIKIKGR